MTFFVCFFLLLLGHFVADYPLQGEYLALSKSRHHPMGIGFIPSQRMRSSKAAP